MVFFSRLNKLATAAATVFNGLSAVALLAMMLLTFFDVVLRLFRHPIPGTYEMVGFFGAIVVSFSLAHTSMARGHIAVDFLVRKLPPAARKVADWLNSLICAILFSLISWQTVIYALDTKAAGEVSMTLQVPVYPFIFGVAVGSFFLCIILILRLVLSFTEPLVKES